MNWCKHGPKFVERLAHGAGPAFDPARRAALADKAAELRKPCSPLRALSRTNGTATSPSPRTPRGLGIHAINLDGDIGPWLQVVKLNGLKEMAERAGASTYAGPRSSS